MRFIQLFEQYGDSTLIIVDVQKDFDKYFTNNYVESLKKYASNYKNVYQIWDNHVDGKNPDKDFLYDKEPDVPTVNNDLYKFPNVREIIEKRYTHNVDVDFFKKILDEEVYNNIKTKENQLKKGQFFPTTEGTIIVFIGNNHQWFHLPKKLYDIFKDLNGKEVVIVGGSDKECLEDIVIAGSAMGVKMKRDHRYIWSATHCPIK